MSYRDVCVECGGYKWGELFSGGFTCYDCANTISDGRGWADDTEPVWKCLEAPEHIWQFTEDGNAICFNCGADFKTEAKKGRA